ncbi:MAG: sodium:calcium antiporter [Alicyclobacillus sp.]|nr:sodium:calcium antiporter [Alicyclobacillus sp.]
MQTAVWMGFALVMILFGAELFTNAIEWLGDKLHLGQSAVGSVLAALGTALPETAVPITAILFDRSNRAAEDVGIGGILGAPFLLVTLGSLVIAVALFLTRGRHRGSAQLHIERRSFERDMSAFLCAYAFVLVVGVIPNAALHALAPWLLVAAYAAFITRTLVSKAPVEDTDDLHPLYLQWKADRPSTAVVALQLVVSLGAIVGGAHLLSRGVETVALAWNIPPFVLSAILIPIATELPETLNSVVWIRQGKDGLALGNITGAMVFQSTVVPAIGIWLTPWRLYPEAMLAGGLTLCAGALIFGVYRLRGALLPGILLAASLLYWLLPLQTLATRYHLVSLHGVSAGLLALAALLTLRATRVARAA